MDVTMRHPGVEGTATVPESAFHRVWGPAGWELTEVQPAAPVPDVDPNRRPQRNDRTDAWRAYARAAGMDAATADSMSRDELVAFYEPPAPAGGTTGSEEPAR